MYKLMLIFLLMLFIQPVNGGDQNQQLFEKAVNDLKHDNYTAAIIEFTRLQNAGVRSSGIYCNLGNAYFKDGKLGEAMLIYNQGLSIYPYNPQLINNRNLLATSLNIPQENYNGFDFANDLLLFKILDYLATVGAVLFFGSSIIFVWLLFCKMNKKLFFYSFSLSATILVTTLCISLFLTSGQKAVVLTDSFSKSGPGKLAKRNFIFKAGENVSVINYFEGWYKVEKYDGARGWVPATDVGIIQ